MPSTQESKRPGVGFVGMPVLGMPVLGMPVLGMPALGMPALGLAVLGLAVLSCLTIPVLGARPRSEQSARQRGGRLDTTIDAARSLLAPHLGHNVIVDIADYDGLDVDLPPPNGWRVIKATTDTFEPLRVLLGASGAPAVGLVDVHGNVIHVDDNEKCRGRKRFTAALREFESKLGRLDKRLSTLLADANRFREKGKPQREIEQLLMIRHLSVRGYAQVTRAETRLGVIELDRHQRLYRILAREGTERARRLISELDDLLAVSIGLDSEAWIRRHLTLLRREITVRRKQRS